MAETLEELVENFTSQIQSVCECPYRSEYLLHPTLTCTSPRRNTALFRVSITGVQALTASAIASHLEAVASTNLSSVRSLLTTESGGETTDDRLLSETTEYVIITVGTVAGTLAIVVPMLLAVAWMSARMCRKSGSSSNKGGTRSMRLSSFRKNNIHVSAPNWPPDAEPPGDEHTLGGEHPKNFDAHNDPVAQSPGGENPNPLYAEVPRKQYSDPLYTDTPENQNPGPLDTETPCRTQYLGPPDFSDLDFSSPAHEQTIPEAGIEQLYATVHKKVAGTASKVEGDKQVKGYHISHSEVKGDATSCLEVKGDPTSHSEVKGDPTSKSEVKGDSTSYLKVKEDHASQQLEREESGSSLVMRVEEEQLLMSLSELKTLSMSEELLYSSVSPVPARRSNALSQWSNTTIAPSPLASPLMQRSAKLAADSPIPNLILPDSRSGVPGSPVLIPQPGATGASPTWRPAPSRSGTFGSPLLQRSFTTVEGSPILPPRSGFLVGSPRSSSTLVSPKLVPRSNSLLANPANPNVNPRYVSASHGQSPNRNRALPALPNSTEVGVMREGEGGGGGRLAERGAMDNRSPLSVASYIASGHTTHDSMERGTHDGGIHRLCKGGIEDFEDDEDGDTYEVLTNPRSRHQTSHHKEEIGDAFGEKEDGDAYEILTSPRQAGHHDNEVNLGGNEDGETYEILTNPRGNHEPRKHSQENSLPSIPTPDTNSGTHYFQHTPSGIEGGDTYEILTTPHQRHHKTSDMDRKDKSLAKDSTLQSADSYEVLTNPRAGWLRSRRDTGTSEFGSREGRSAFTDLDTYDTLPTPDETSNLDHTALESADSYEVLTNPRARWLKEPSGGNEHCRDDWSEDATANHTPTGPLVTDLETGNDVYEVMASPKPHPHWFRGQVQPVLARGQSAGSYLPDPQTHSLPREVKGRAEPGTRMSKEYYPPHQVGTQLAENNIYASVDQLEVTYAELYLPASSAIPERGRKSGFNNKLLRAATSGSRLGYPPERVASLPSLFKKKGSKNAPPTTERGVELKAEPEDEYMPMASLAAGWRHRGVRQDRPNDKMSRMMNIAAMSKGGQNVTDV